MSFLNLKELDTDSLTHKSADSNCNKKEKDLDWQKVMSVETPSFRN
jgi:hypothetical protein